MKSIKNLINNKFLGPVWFCLIYLFTYTFIGSLMTISYGAIMGMFYIDVITAFVSYLLLSKKAGKLWVEIKYKFTDKKQMIWLGLCFVFLFIFVWIIGQLFGTVIYHDNPQSNFTSYQQILAKNPGGYLLCSILVAPVCEELMYRGVVYSSFKARYSVTIAWITQALVFAGMHMTIVQIPGVFLLGLFLALIDDLYGSIWYGVVFHILYNIGSFILAGTHIPWLFTQLWFLSIIYVIILVIVCLIFYKFEYQNKAKSLKQN